MPRYIYPFDHRHRMKTGLEQRLGGKGASLNMMTTLESPDIHVPPGFTIVPSACREVLAEPDQRWPRKLKADVDQALDALLEQVKDRSLPLFSVRSGAPRPMLGAMRTILNVGCIPALEQRVPEPERHLYLDCRRRFLASFGVAVLGIEQHYFDEELEAAASAPAAWRDDHLHLGSPELLRLINKYEEIISEKRPSDPVPDELREQIYRAVTAVFESWDSPQAKNRRRSLDLDTADGTAVHVQMMVFGNRDQRSGSGVAYSRNPASGEHAVTGDFLLAEQGEEVVRGTSPLTPLSQLLTDERFTGVAEALRRALDILERDVYQDMCEIEFTFEGDRLWLLQARRAHRSGRAAIEAARAMVHEDGLIDEGEAVDRIEVEALSQALYKTVDVAPKDERSEGLIARGGISVSPGAVRGVAAIDPKDAEERADRGESVIWITRFTRPEHATVIQKAAGVVEFRRGFSSHSMVLARSYGKPFIADIRGELRPDEHGREGRVAHLILPEESMGRA